MECLTSKYSSAVCSKGTRGCQQLHCDPKQSQQSASNAGLDVPCGWRRGEPLVVSKRDVHYKSVWFVEQKPSFNFREGAEKFKPGHIGACWFYSFEKFAEFIQWWHRAI